MQKRNEKTIIFVDSINQDFYLTYFQNNSWLIFCVFKLFDGLAWKNSFNKTLSLYSLSTLTVCNSMKVEIKNTKLEKYATQLNTTSNSFLRYNRLTIII